MRRATTPSHNKVVACTDIAVGTLKSPHHHIAGLIILPSGDQVARRVDGNRLMPDMLIT
jgi:hypothetical protein